MPTGLFLTSSYRHLEGASGILAVVKAILMIKKGIILPTAGFEQMNVKIEGRDRLKVAQSPIPWPENEARRVIVTNFGECAAWPDSLASLLMG